MIIILESFPSLAQNNMEIVLQGCYGGSENEFASSIVSTGNGYLVFGETRSDDGNVSNNHGDRDIWIVNIDSKGNILWERCYGGSGPELANNIIKADDNTYYFGAWTWSDDGDIQSGNHGGYDRWIVKINIDGEILWEKCYGGSKTEYGGQLELLSNGNILTYGATFSSDGDVPINNGYLDVWVMIISPEGEILQSNVFGNIGRNNVFDVVETSDGGFFMASEAEEEEGMVIGDFHGGTDVWAVKLDADLNIEWQKLYGGSDDDYGYRGVLELEDGYLFLASTNSNDGDISGFHGGFTDIWAVRIDTIGNIIWQKCFGGSESDWSGELCQSDDGDFFIIGETSSHDGDVYGNNSWQGSSDIWMFKLSEEGELEWQECYGGYGNERIYEGVIKKSDNNWVIAGRTNNNSYDVQCDLHGYEDFWLFQLKDCAYYAPAVPAAPCGADTACSAGGAGTVYTVTPAQNAWSYEWQLLPAEAGTINGDSTLATVTWASGYEGTATLVVRSTNDCGQSAWSDPKYTQVNTCLGTKETAAAKAGLKVYPNPAKDYIVFELSTTAGNGKAEIILYNAFGQPATKLKVKEGRTVWHTVHMPAGLYYYKTEINGTPVSGKVVVRD